MSATSDHVSLTGSKMSVFLIASDALLPPPPANRMRPSGSWAWPLQKRSCVNGWLVSVPVAGSKTREWVGEPASALPETISTLPVCSVAACTANAPESPTTAHEPTLAGSPATYGNTQGAGERPGAAAGCVTSIRTGVPQQ